MTEITTKNSEKEVEIVSENPLLKRKNKIPGEVIHLPSRGIFYKNGELASEVIDGDVLAFPLTSADELVMKSYDMLFHGSAIESVFQRCCPQIKKPLQLLTSDVDFILTYLRKLTYGNHIPIRWKCNKCGENAVTHEYNIPISYFIENTKELDQQYYEENCIITLESGNVVKLKPITFADFLKMQQTPETKVNRSVKEFQDFILGTIATLIEEVDGITNRDHIAEWLGETSFVLNEIEDALPKLSNWGVEFKYPIKCKDCGETEDVTLPLNPVHFFILPSSPKTKSE